MLVTVVFKLYTYNIKYESIFYNKMDVNSKGEELTGLMDVHPSNFATNFKCYFLVY